MRESSREQRPRYRAFLLRCWLDDEPEDEMEPDDEFAWRFTLVNLANEQDKKGFACLEELCAYVKSELEEST